MLHAPCSMLYALCFMLDAPPCSTTAALRLPLWRDVGWYRAWEPVDRIDRTDRTVLHSERIVVSYRGTSRWGLGMAGMRGQGRGRAKRDRNEQRGNKREEEGGRDPYGLSRPSLLPISLSSPGACRWPIMPDGHVGGVRSAPLALLLGLLPHHTRLGRHGGVRRRHQPNNSSRSRHHFDRCLNSNS